MRRTAILVARLAIVAALAGAVLDLPLPASTAARTRVHLVDRSGSALVPDPPESITHAESARLIEWDKTLRQPGDSVLWASFGGDVRFESEAVDPESTDLAGAIEAALARNATEIVLHSDGRADPGRALLLCRARNVPVHAVPLGPRAPRDARIARVRAPAEAAPGERFAIEVTVESSFDGPARLRLDGETQELRLAAGVPALATFRNRTAGPFSIRLETEDACPKNNELPGVVFERSERPRLLVLSERAISVPGYDVKATRSFEDPDPYAAVVVDNVELSPEAQKALASAVRTLGRGLLLLGGPKSHALGKWAGTPLEELSPLRATPDHRVAVLFAIDASGSMNKPGRLDVVLDTVRQAWRRFGPGDDVAAMPSVKPRFITDPSELRRITAGGETNLAGALEQGRLHLQGRRPPRKHLILLTDGEAAADETPDKRIQEGRELERLGIGLTVVTTNKKLEVGTNVPIKEWKELEKELDRILAGIREVRKADPGALDLAAHPVTEGVAPVRLAWMNLTSLQPGAQAVATVGRPPAVYPAAAFQGVGHGRVGAFAFETPPPRLLKQAVDYVAQTSAGGWSLAIDPPHVRARPRGAAPAEGTLQARIQAPGAEGTIPLRQVRSDLWEGTLPPIRPGTVRVVLPGGAAAAATPPSPEYAALGVDRKALERLTSETGGRVLRSPGDLDHLPRPSRPARSGSRPLCLAAALVLLFVELGLSTFWKP